MVGNIGPKVYTVITQNLSINFEECLVTYYVFSGMYMHCSG